LLQQNYIFKAVRVTDISEKCLFLALELLYTKSTPLLNDILIFFNFFF